jgi:putative aldouronate transport system substrate-binding protein
MTEELFGGVYYLPRPRFDVNLPGDPLPNHQLVYIRRDWAEAVGFPIKDGYKTSEILEYARLVKEQDPGGLGNNLVPIAATSENAMRMFINHNSTFFDFFYKGDDGKYQWGAASDDTLTGLKLMYQAYDEGLLYPEFFTLVTDQDHDMFRIAGNAAVIYMDGTATGMQVNMVARFEGSTGLDSTETVHAATVLGEDGNYHLRDLINYWCTLIFSPDIDEEVFTRYMDALDYGCTDEGYLVQVAGFEGEDYEYDAEGNMVNLNPEGMPLEGSEGKYPSIGGYMIANMKLWDDFMVYSPVVNPFWATRSWDMYMFKVENGTPESFPKTDWTVFSHDSPSRRQANYQYADEYANIVSNSGSEAELEANWKAWIDSQMPLVQPVLEELDAK